MKRLSLLSVLMCSTLFLPSAQSESKSLDLAFEWVEDFDLDDDLEIKEAKDQEIPSRDLSFDDDDFDFLAEVDFDLDDLEEGEAPKGKKTDEEEIQFVLIEGPVDSKHTIAEVDFDLEEISDEEPIESDIIFSSSGVSHKAPLQEEIEEIAIAEIKQIPAVAKKSPKPTNLVTNREYFEFVKSSGHNSPSYWGGKQPPTGTENQPVVNVSYKDAYLYVVWAGGRLPTDAELRLTADSSDSNEAIGEWTATAAGLKKAARQSYSGGHIGVQFIPGHLIFINKDNDSVALENSEINTNTGFRSISNK